MFTEFSSMVSQRLFKKTNLSSESVLLVEESSFWDHLSQLKQMKICQPLIVLATSKGVFICFKLLRPFLEFRILIQSSHPESLCRKLKLSLIKETSKVNKLHQVPFFQKMQTLPLDMKLHYLSKINPLEGNSLQWALAGLYEKAWKVQVPKKAIVIRTFICEIQRILWGLEYLKDISTKLHLKSWQDLWLNYRECFFQIQEIISGSRIFPDMIVIGGVNKDISMESQKNIQKYLLEISQKLFLDIKQFNQKANRFLKNFFPIDRDALEISGWGGIVVKASHSWWDARLFAPYGLEKYAPAFITSRRLPLGDALDRLICVSDEIFCSLQHSSSLLSDLAESISSPLAVSISKNQIVHPNGVTFAIEGASGPIYAGVMDERIAITTSSMRGSFHLSSFLSNIKSQDVDLALSSLGYQECEGCLA